VAAGGQINCRRGQRPQKGANRADQAQESPDDQRSDNALPSQATYPIDSAARQLLTTPKGGQGNGSFIGGIPSNFRNCRLQQASR